MIVIIDYGMGNLRSVQKAFERIHIPVIVSSNRQDILNAKKIVLPGVGNFEKGMINLKAANLIEALNEAVIENKIPVLGICLGMQLMTEFSEEGNVAGLGWIKGATLKFNLNSNKLKVPHMGWNNIHISNSDSIFKNIDEDNLFYFVHSYYVTCENKNEILATTIYETSFVSSFKKGNIYGCQFHPEKSHEPGLKVLSNYVNI